MRILIIEDEIIIARFIEQQLSAHFNCDTAIAINSEEVYAMLPDFLPHLVLCDINLQETNDGLSLISDLRLNYAFEVIFITSYQSRPIIEAALTYQPLNYIIKPVDEAAIFAALKIAWPIIEKQTALGKAKENIAVHTLLSAVERKIVQHILDQKTSREIADLLFLSPYTVKNHRHRICRKLGLTDGNNALLKWAMHNKALIE
jgi:DNA-binding NarL/FixJ family response regulator